MPLGIVSESEFEKELNNSNTPYSNRVNPVTPKHENEVLTGEVIDPVPLGRGKGNVEVPESLRKVISDTHVTDGRKSAVELASYFSISKQSAQAYGKYGSTSLANYDEPDKTEKSKEISNHLTNTKNRIIKRAHNKLLTALSNITDDKLQSAKIKDVAIVAKAMSGIIKDMEPDSANADAAKNQPTFVVYAPRMIKEENYDTIHVVD